MRKQITVDGKKYTSKASALRTFSQAILCCDGSEKNRMAFAYFSIISGYTDIDTYNEVAQ